MIAGSRAIRKTQGRLDEATHTRHYAHAEALDNHVVEPRVPGVLSWSTYGARRPPDVSNGEARPRSLLSGLLSIDRLLSLATLGPGPT